MKVDAIVYTSNSGFTERYAKMLGEKIGLMVYNIKDAKKSLQKGTNVIYLGWLMAGSIKDYKKAAKRFNIKLLCGVSLGPTGSQIDGIRKIYNISNDFPVFTLQGGMDRSKLHGINKFMINMLTKMLSKKDNKTAEEQEMLDLIIKGGDYVNEDNLKEILKYLS